MMPVMRSCRRRAGGWAGTVILLLVALGLSACAREFNEFPDLDRAETAVEYEIRLEGAPDEDIAGLIEESLLVYRRQEVGAQSLGLLRRRARDDIETVQKILRSVGYFESDVDIRVDRVAELEPEPFSATGTIRETASAIGDTVAGAVDSVADLFRAPLTQEEREAEQPDIEEQDGPPPGGFARVTIEVEPGPQFTLAEHDLILFDSGPEKPPPTIPTAQQFGSPVGEAAVAEDILLAEAQAVQMLKQSGRPYAVRRARDSAADLELNTIEVATAIATGREYVFGGTRIRGAPSVSDEYLLTYKPYVAGERVDVRLLEEYQEELIETGLFDAGSVRVPEEPPVGDAAPVMVEMEERPPRTVAAGAEYATDAGPAVNASFEHRNLGRENETLRFDLFGGLEEQRFETRFRKPQFRRPGQDLTAGFLLERLDDDAYEGINAVGTAGVEREIGEFWRVGYGGLVSASFVEDEGEDETAYLAGLPVFAAFDDTDDLLDPTRGLRLRQDLTPFAGINDSEFVQFLKSDTLASTYWDITDDERYILALRGRLGSILGAGDVDDVPPPQRFYSGGGGSVRGYDDRLIGPLDEDDDPIGGRSVVEGAVELRATIWDETGIGGVLFVDAGSVSTDPWPSFDEGIQVAAGTGLRYKSPVGPLRFDIAVPVNPRDVDDAFQFYISIGQAF